MHHNKQTITLAGLCLALTAAAPRQAVADKPPEVRIVEPAERAQVFAGEVIQFRAEAMDPEDRQLAPSKLVWTSDISGVIGTGLSCQKTLPLGVHLISFQAADSKGNVARTSSVVRVTARPKQPPPIERKEPKVETRPENSSPARAASRPEGPMPSTQPSPPKGAAPVTGTRPASRPAAKLPQSLPADSPLKAWKSPTPTQFEAATIERIQEKMTHLAERDKAAFLQELLGLSCSLNHAAVAEFALAHGAEVNRPDKDGYPPIQLAVQSSYIRAVCLLLMHGADCNDASLKEGHTALHTTLARSSKMTLELILGTKPDLNAVDLSGQTPLHKVVLNKDYYAEGLLEVFLSRKPALDVQDNEGMTALHLTSQAGKLPLVRMLLAAKADTSMKSKGGHTALHLAVQNSRVAVIEELLKAGCDAAARDNEGQTALHLAVLKNLPDIVALLIERKAPLEAPDRLGRTPLALADQLKGGGQIAARLRLAGATK